MTEEEGESGYNVHEDILKENNRLKKQNQQLIQQNQELTNKYILIEQKYDELLKKYKSKKATFNLEEQKLNEKYPNKPIKHNTKWSNSDIKKIMKWYHQYKTGQPKNWKQISGELNRTIGAIKSKIKLLKQNKFICNNCWITFSNDQELQMHIKKCTNNK